MRGRIALRWRSETSYGRHASERKGEMSKRDKKDEDKANKTHGASDRDAMHRRE